MRCDAAADVDAMRVAAARASASCMNSFYSVVVVVFERTGGDGYETDTDAGVRTGVMGSGKTDTA